ncbi:phage tail spike protein [Peribacillus sp. NPDC096540]|uniref:phage tail spike protein n=1 Tax=Peribacillus sp. NPDC096540 TaxID=3390612 RepID=UPI003CFDA3CF
MTDLLLFDPYDNLLAVLSNEAEEACPFWSAPFKELLNQGSTFEFTAEGNHEDAQHIVAENQVAFMDKDGFFRLFTIKEPERTDGEEGPVITAVCEAAMLELNDEVIEDVRPYNVTLKTAITKALEGVRWKVGVVAELGLDSTNFYYITPTEAITECINTWGGELRDRVEIEGNKITGRFIDILPRRGEDIGKRWEIDKDILSITERVQSYPKTALYGRGSSLEIEDEEGEATGGFTRKITFADIEWKVKNGDPVDKPKGQKWVGDPEALIVFGRENADGTLRHRKGIFESSEQEDPAALLQETWEALQQQKHPIRNFEMSVFLLENIIGYEHEKVRLGDTTFALDYSFAKPIEVEERIISFEYDVSDPDNSGVVELGNFIDLYSDDARLDQIESELNDNKGVWNNGGKKPITDDKIENVPPTKPLNVIASGLFQNVLVEWDFVNTISIANYEVYASQIQGFTPDISNLTFRGKTSIYTHQAGNNQQWYFRVRAVNTHGVAGPFSEEAMAQTARIISDDILFGPDIAAELRELSKTAGILADGAVDTSEIADDAITSAKIVNLAVGTAAIANAAITNAKIANLSVGTAQLQDAAITNAKIANASIDSAKISSLAADKIKAGIVTGVLLRSIDETSRFEVQGGRLRMDVNNGNNLTIDTTGIYYLNSSGQILFQSTKKMTTSDIFGTAEYNAYLAAFNETRSVTYATALTGSGFVDDYDYVPHRAKGFYGDYINKNPGSPGLHVYIKPLTGGEARITRNETTDDYRPLRAQYVYTQRIDSNPQGSNSNHIYIGSTDEVRISTAPGLENTTGRLRAGSIFASSITLNNLGNGSHLNLLLVGSDSEVRVKHSADDSYRPIRARTFTTDTSMRENKKDIEVFSEDSLAIFRNAQIYTYRRKTDDRYAFKQLGMMIDETPRILHGEIGDSFDLYALTSYMGKGIKDIITVLDLHSDEINLLKLENQYLKQKVQQLEDRLDAA